MHRWVFMVFVGCVFLTWQCQSGSEKAGDEANEKAETREKAEKSEPGSNQLLAKGVSIAKATGKALKSELTNAIAEGGVENAIDYCSANAIALTDSLSKVHNARISRVTHKPRNPANKADSLEMTLIKDYQNKNESNTALKPKLVKRADQKVVYAPITIKGQLCLNCHGEKGKDIADEDYITIQLHYENDQATGFKMGELRGMWKIAFKERVS